MPVPQRRDGGDRHRVRGVRVHNVDCAFSNRRPQPPRGSRIDLGRGLHATTSSPAAAARSASGSPRRAATGEA